MLVNAAAQMAKFLSRVPLPALDSTLSHLNEQRLDDSLLPRDLATTLLRDPLLSLAVIKHLAERPQKARRADITTVEHALMMLGIDPAFEFFSSLKTLDEVLHNPVAALSILGIARRSYVAGRIGQHWAAVRKDTQSEEVQVAALLRDMAEMLLWIAMPSKAAAISELMRADPTLRSAQAQRMVLGFTLMEVERELCRIWQLPALLAELVEGGELERPSPRVQNVELAVRLTRHCARDWSNPALPDDWNECSAFLGEEPEETRARTLPQLATFAHQWETQNASSLAGVGAGLQAFGGALSPPSNALPPALD